MSHNHTDTLVGTPYNEGFRVVLVIVGTVMFLSGIFGNVLLMVVMYKSQVKKDFPKVFIANLALADLVVVCLLPFLVLDLALGWQPVVNVTHCRVNAAILSVGYCVSIMSLITVSFNRYMKICHPLVFHRIFSITRRNLAICGGLWAFGALSNIPVFFPSLAPYSYDSDCRTCNARGDSRTVNYGSVAMILLLLVPVGLIGYFNVAIYRRWYKSRKKVQKGGKKGAGNTKTPVARIMKKSAPETNTLETEDSGVGSNGITESATGRRPNHSNRKVTTAEFVTSKENPCFETSFSDSIDNDIHTHSQDELETSNQQQSNGNQIAYGFRGRFSSTPSLKADNDKEITSKQAPFSSALSGSCQIHTISGSSEFAKRFHKNQKATAKSEAYRCQPGSDFEISGTVAEDMGTSAWDSKMSSTGVLCPNSNLNNSTDIGSISRQVQKPRAKTSVKKKVRPDVALVRSLLVISLSLFALYTPFSVILVLSIFLEDAVPPQITVISALLLYANCSINWIIYGAMNTVFRKAYVSAMKTLMFCSRR